MFLGHLEPITLFDQGGIHVSLYFAKDSPLGHPGVAVVVVSTVNTSAVPVSDYVFQAAVPKVKKTPARPEWRGITPPFKWTAGCSLNCKQFI